MWITRTFPQTAKLSTICQVDSTVDNPVLFNKASPCPVCKNAGYAQLFAFFISSISINKGVIEYRGNDGFAAGNGHAHLGDNKSPEAVDKSYHGKLRELIHNWPTRYKGIGEQFFP